MQGTEGSSMCADVVELADHSIERKSGTRSKRVTWDLIVYEFPDTIGLLRWCGLPAGGEP